MKKLSTYVAGAAVGLMGTMAQAADDVTLQLKWVTQAQFAGYYVAQDKGFYDEEDLNVTIKPGGPDIAPTQVLAGGGADVAVEWFFGNEFPFLSWMSKLELPTEGGEDGVTVLKQGFNVDPLLQNQAACVSTMTYNEYWQVIDAGLTPDDLNVFKYEEQGVATLEDGLYALEENLADPAFEDKMVRFVRASMKGWKYAEENPDEAAEIVLDNDASGAQTEEHQKRMMGEVAKLTAGSNGALDEADYERTVQSLLSGGSDPVITVEPSGAWTHAITDKALN